jgi:hypothetical protein
MKRPRSELGCCALEEKMLHGHYNPPPPPQILGYTVCPLKLLYFESVFVQITAFLGPEDRW